jgi:hypothetical protein
VSRVEFCNATLGVLSKDAGVWNSALMRDKLTAIHRILSIKNMRYRASASLGELHEQPLPSPEVAEWRAVGTFWIVGAFICNGEGLKRYSNC